MCFWSDNQAAQSLSSEGGSWRTRHFTAKVEGLREQISFGLAVVNHTPGVEQKADGLTKSLPQVLLSKFRDDLGMKLQVVSGGSEPPSAAPGLSGDKVMAARAVVSSRVHVGQLPLQVAIVAATILPVAAVEEESFEAFGAFVVTVLVALLGVVFLLGLTCGGRFRIGKVSREVGTQTTATVEVHVSEFGECFHKDPKCWGLRNANVVKSKRPCSLCVG